MSQPDPRSQPDNLGAFFAENKTLIKEYLETRMKIYRLQSIRLFSRSAGYFAWIMISALLAFLFLLFGGLMLGFWFSGLLGSFVSGFGLVALGRQFVAHVLCSVVATTSVVLRTADGANGVRCRGIGRLTRWSG